MNENKEAREVVAAAIKWGSRKKENDEDWSHAAADAVLAALTAAGLSIMATLKADSGGEIVKRKQEVARGAAALDDLLTMLGIDTNERDDFGSSIAETLAGAVICAARRVEDGSNV